MFFVFSFFFKIDDCFSSPIMDWKNRSIFNQHRWGHKENVIPCQWFVILKQQQQQHSKFKNTIRWNHRKMSIVQKTDPCDHIRTRRYGQRWWESSFHCDIAMLFLIVCHWFTLIHIQNNKIINSKHLKGAVRLSITTPHGKITSEQLHLISRGLLLPLLFYFKFQKI